MELVVPRTSSPGRWLGVLVSVILVSAPVWAQEDDAEVPARPASSASAVSSVSAAPPAAPVPAPAGPAASAGVASVGGVDALRQRYQAIARGEAPAGAVGDQEGDGEDA